MPIRFDEIGRRLRAYRVGRNLTATEVAERIGVSRAAVYRLEKGELVKIETLEKLSALLDVSLPSLLGVGVEYYSNAISFFERLRQIQEGAVHMFGNFAPFSSMLIPDNCLKYVRLTLLEALSQIEAEAEAAETTVDRFFQILTDRRGVLATKRTPVVHIISLANIERFLRFGLVGRFDLAPEVVGERREAARRVVEHLMDVVCQPPIGMQIGIVDIPAPQTFQVFEMPDGAAVSLSPYRVGDYPNLTAGIAMITSAPEAVRHFKETIVRQWDIAHKGESGARALRAVLDRVDEGAARPLRAIPSTGRRI